MKRRSILRLLSCCLAGILLVEAPIQVDAAALGSSESLITSVDEDAPETDNLDEKADEDEPEADVLDEKVDEEDPEADILDEKIDGDDSGVDIPNEKANEDAPETDVLDKKEDEITEPEEKSEEDKQEEPAKTIVDGEEEDSDKELPAPDSAESDDKEDISAEPQTAYLSLTGLQYGSQPEYSENFDADEASMMLTDLSEALADGQADVSEFTITPETLEDALTWLAEYEEAYYTMLPYVEYTYIEKEDLPEVQTVTVSRVPEEKLLSLSAVRDVEDVKISYVPVDGVEQYRLFRIAGDEITELSMEAGQELFVDRVVFEEQTSYRYIVCGYQPLDDEMKLCTFSRFTAGEYQLEAPENLETESGAGSVTLTWDAVELASGYEIEAADQENGEFTLIGQVEGTEYTQNQLEDGEEYFYRIRAYSDMDTEVVYSAYSAVESGSATEKPAAPELKYSISKDGDKLVAILNWKAVENADGYIVYQVVAGEYEPVGAPIMDKVSEEFSYTISGMKFNESRRYAVSAFVNDDTGTPTEGEKSNEVEIVIGFEAMKLKASSSSYNEVDLSWNQVLGADGYEIKRNGWGSPIRIESGKTLTYKDGSVRAATKYTYQIRPYQLKGEGNLIYSYGEWSEAVSVATKLPQSKISSVTSVNYNTVKISWAKVTGAAGYEVYRSTSASGTGSLVKMIGSGSTLTCQDTGLTVNKTYYYKVRPYGTVGGDKVYGDYSAAVKGVSKLGAVTGGKAVSASYKSVKVSWSKTAGASGYEVYHSNSKNSGYKLLKTVTGTSVTQSGLTAGKTHYYKVRAYRTVSGKKVYGEYCSVVSAKPVPGTVTAKRSTLTYNSVKMTWSKISGANGYEIYRSGSKNGTYSKIKTITSGSTLSYINKSLSTGKTYYYKIRAYRTVNGKKVYGSFSAVISGKPVLKTPKLKKSTVTYDSAKLTWNKIDGAKGYELYRSTSKDGTYKKVKSLTGGSTVNYTNTKLTTGTTYYYKVRAYRTVSGKKVYGSFSEPINAKPVLSKVTGLKAASTGDDSSGSIEVSWSKVDGATGYVVARATSKDGTYQNVKTVTPGSTVSYIDKGLAFGQTYYYKVYATRGNYSTAMAGPVEAMVIAMNLSDDSLTLNVGESQKVAVATIPKVTVSWSTSDSKVATVDSNGKVTAVGSGTAEIYVKAHGLTKSIKVTVKGKNEGIYKGIDVSSYQGSIDWKKVKNDGIDFAMIRVITGSSSSTTRDTMFKENYDGARDNGIKVGLYRYSYATSRTKARTEAQAIIDTLHGRKLDYPIVMDMEDSSILSGTDSNARRSEIILAFKEVIEDAGYDFALYANTTWLNNYLDMDMLKNVDIWIARWRPLDQGHGYTGKGNVTMWQYSNEGKVNGISGKVDLNVSYKNY